MTVFLMSGVHPFKLDRRHVLGFLLAQQGRCACAGINLKQPSTLPILMITLSQPGGSGRDNSADDDHPDQLRERGPAQNLLHEVHRHLPLRLLLHGLRGLD